MSDLEIIQKIEMDMNIVLEKRSSEKDVSGNCFVYNNLTVVLIAIRDSGCSLSIWVKSLSGLKNLIINIKQPLPEWVGSMTQLEALDLSSSKLKKLPEWIGNLFQLQALNLRYNRLKHLPKQLSCLTQLEHLNLSENELKSIPEYLCRLIKLKVLYADCNELRRIPEEIGCLTQLQSLDLSLNILIDLPEQIGCLTRLRSLDLNGNKLRHLSEHIKKLVQLEYLDIGDNNFESFPEWLGDLHQLNTLIMSTRGNLVLTQRQINKLLKELEDGMLENGMLEDGMLEDDELEDDESTDDEANKHNDTIYSLPKSIGNLAQLRCLDLSGLKLDIIPKNVVNLKLPFIFKRDDGINLENVILTRMDVNLFNQHREVIDAFYSDELIELKECKIILLGEGGAGKSSLIERMINNTFNPNKRTTEGVMIHTWSLDITDTDIAKIRVLDFGGQEIMHSMHRCFLTDRSVYIIVCESRADTDIEHTVIRWLENIKSFSGNSPVILALNKYDKNENIAVNEKYLRDNYPNLKSVVKTSAEKENRMGVLNLMEAIRTVVSESSGYRYLFNLRWIKLKQYLEHMKENYTKNTTFSQLCMEFGIYNAYLQQQILDWFMDLGISYYYWSNDEYRSDLDSLRILKPKWLTNGMYRLLLRSDKSTGLFTTSMIDNTLGTPHENDIDPDTVYTPTEAKYILHVMRRFKLSYRLDNGYEFIPSLLNKNEPENIQFDKNKALHISWKCNYIPNTVLHRLMIDKVMDIDFNCIWRNGALLYDKINDRHALIEFDGYTEDCIDIYVKAKNDARIYMEEIRKSIKRILEDLTLNVIEIIHFRIGDFSANREYQEVLNQYYDGKKEMYVGSYGGKSIYVNPSVILQQTYMLESIDRERKIVTNTTIVTGNGNAVQTGVGSYVSQQQTQSTYEELAHEISKTTAISEEQIDELLELLKRLVDTGEMKSKDAKLVTTTVETIKCKTTLKEHIEVLRNFLGDAANLTTIMDCAIQYLPSLTAAIYSTFIK